MDTHLTESPYHTDQKEVHLYGLEVADTIVYDKVLTESCERMRKYKWDEGKNSIQTVHKCQYREDRGKIKKPTTMGIA